MIKIVFEGKSGTVLLDQKLYTIVDHSVEFDCSGWHLLSISSASTDHLQIKDILIENISIGNMMLIMFLTESKECTFGWVDRRSFSMPLHPNYATFRKVIFSNITQGDFGNQIYQQYDFAFNSKVDLQKSYPKSIVDYFDEEISPVWHKKYSNRSPWFLGPAINRSRLADEINKVKHKFPARKINLDSYRGWEDSILKFSSIEEVKQFGLEYFSEILADCRFTELLTVNLGYLPPGGYINTHKDLSSSLKRIRNKVYIPIDFAPGNYYKFSPGGYVPLEQSHAICLNTDVFLHGVVNDSDSGRLIIGCNGYADWNQ